METSLNVTSTNLQDEVVASFLVNASQEIMGLVQQIST